jgi:hypothetical protein
MSRFNLRFIVSLVALIASTTPDFALGETVNVKYRGSVDLEPFRCASISRSSLVNRVCYGSREQYMIIRLQGVYYHYCEIDAGTVSQLVGVQSVVFSSWLPIGTPRALSQEHAAVALCNERQYKDNT